MITRTPRATGLGSAIGCQFQSSENRLYYVESDPGNLSVLDLIPRLQSIVFTGLATTMPPDTSLSLFNGTSAQGGQIRWDHLGPGGGRVVRGQGTCQLASLGVVDYDAVDYAGLTTLTYQAALSGEPGPGNQLVVGTVFAVFNWDPGPTDPFHYAKVQVLAIGASITVRWRAYRLQPATHVLGTGYSAPQDVVIAANGDTAYISERSGSVVRVSLSGNANRAAAVMVAPGLTSSRQMALDEARGALYVIEFAAPGRLVRIDLASGTATTAFAPVQRASGVLLATDGRFAYITEQGATGPGSLSKLDLVASTRQLLWGAPAAALTMLTWSDGGENSIVLTERAPGNKVWSIDLNTTPPQVHAMVTGTPNNPNSVGVVTPDRILVCCDKEIDDYGLTGPLFTTGGPLLVGIGSIPVDRVEADGLANTSVDPAYPFQFKDCPFGGSLPTLVNHARAFSLGARFYKIFVEGVLQRTPLSDYRWDSSAVPQGFKITSLGPDANGFYKLRQPGELWMNPHLSCFVDTAGLPEDTLQTISVQIYTAANNGTQINTSGEITSVRPRIVNAGPTAAINAIFHDGTLVPVCQIISSGSYAFQFSVTAYHPSQWLRSWGLNAYWGDNKGGVVAGNAYPGTPSKRWNDASAPLPATPLPPSPVVPAAPGWSCIYSSSGAHATPPVPPLDPTSYRCAHTFWLNVYDRVINGWNFIHGGTYHQSITINLPDPPAPAPAKPKVPTT